ncbi:MAG TPA: carboxylesterase family protein [Rhizomicrobium sp.]|jgi:para-nitrobenzyl esterase|nr:carboxylesterase family protein [Rhizomicrobium sp.]
MNWKWLAVAAALLSVAPAVAAPPVVRTEAGAVEGVRAGGLDVFKGVPFAAPPVGPLRWRAPQPVAAWSGVRQTTAFGPACMQSGVSMPGEAPPAVSEDCLTLNVWAPAGARGLPVLVWIYGGGFSNGNAAMPLYWGDRLARRGVIVVTFNYRVGPLGFLAHPELTAESGDGSSGNYGFRDQIAALRWVQTNIAAFGGDPAKVTIAGQSAGAASVSVLMASPLAKGLFRGAIAQSGGLFEPLQLAPNYQLANAEKDGVAYAASVGAHSLAELRTLPAAALLKGDAAKVTHPVIEPAVMPRSPYEVFAAGEQARVPVLVGSNADEARSLIDDLDTVTTANYASGIAKRWGALPAPLLDAYPHATDAEAKAARLGFERDLRFGWDDWAWARLQAKAGAPTFYYHFTQAPPFPKSSVYGGWGPSHFADLWYMSDHLDQEHWAWTASDRALADAMAGYWTNFVKTGDPNGRGLTTWPAFGAGGRVMTLGVPLRAGDVPNLRSLGVFDAVYDQVRGKPFGAP